MIIIITGTPGTGKTSYAKKLAASKGYAYIDGNEIIKKYKLSEGYDEKNKCDIVNTDTFNAQLISIIVAARKARKSLIIDSHLSHYISPKYVDKCIVMRCSNLNELKKRLQTRKYNTQKIKDNLEAEIMESCLQDAIASGHKVEVIETGM